MLFKGTAAGGGAAGAAGEGGGVSAAAAAAAEVPLLAAVWLGTADGSRLVGVAFLDSATRYMGVWCRRVEPHMWQLMVALADESCTCM